MAVGWMMASSQTTWIGRYKTGWPVNGMNVAVRTNGMWIESRYWKLACRFRKSCRPSATARTTVVKSSSSRTIEAASRALRVPRLPIAIPTSAACSAGTSLTPSPVTATSSPAARRARTIESL